MAAQGAVSSQLYKFPQPSATTTVFVFMFKKLFSSVFVLAAVERMAAGEGPVFPNIGRNFQSEFFLPSIPFVSTMKAQILALGDLRAG